MNLKLISHFNHINYISMTMNQVILMNSSYMKFMNNSENQTEKYFINI
jgi:hypothetical protein